MPDLLKSFEGLSQKEVKARQEEGLTNKPKHQHVKSNAEIFISNAFNVFNMINLAVISFLLYFYFDAQDTRLLLDSVGIITVTLANTLIAIVQETKASRTLEKMDLLKNQEVTVIREGQKHSINKHDIVKDDVLLLNKGDQVVVDGKVLDARLLEIDESLLTGESHAINKKTGDKLLSGSFCLYGSAYYQAEHVGQESFASGILHHAKKYKFTISPLQKKINFLFVLSFAITILLVGYEFFRSLTAGAFNLEEARKISTIATSLIPEGLVFFSSITFTIGIIRIAGIGAIIQKINAIDLFPTINVMCLDKTGTLTQNKISVYKVKPFKGIDDREISSILGSFSHFSTEQNPTVQALNIFTPKPGLKKIDELPFRSELKMSAMQLRNGANKNEVFILGGYDVLRDVYKGNWHEEAQELYEKESLNGRRNLLFAKSTLNENENLNADKIKAYQIEPLAIVSLRDEPRHDAKDALKLFNANNISTKIISGDATDSVLSTLDEIDWHVPIDEVMEGKAFTGLDAGQKKKAVIEKSVFTRLSPEHKLEIIKTLKKQGLETAVIGDGVNDLMALKESNLGIAMEEGSIITKEVSDIVLLKNRFNILPRIFDEGNKIINTVSYVSNLFLSKNVLVIVLSMLPWFLNVVYPLTPRKGALISMLGIGLPAYFIALKNSNIRSPKSFFRQLIWFILISSPIILGLCYFSAFLGESIFGFTPTEASNTMLAILVILTSANFLGAVIYEDSKNAKYYAFFAILMVATFIVAGTIQFNFVLLNGLTAFYEIPLLLPNEWKVIAAICIPGIPLLLMLHYLRHLLLEKLGKNSQHPIVDKIIRLPFLNTATNSG